MANKLSNLLRKVFFSSLAGIVASNASANVNSLVFQPVGDDNKVESISSKKNDLSLKLLLKKNSNNEWAFMSHRSHRSHSSHRSHYSSYAGGGSGSGTSTSKQNSGLRSNDNSGGTSTNSANSTTNLQLGARTLKKGMSGTDVTQLINILLKKKYLILDDGGTEVTGVYTYDETVEDAVKKFQSDNGLTSDGVCNTITIYYLKNL